MMPDFAMMYEVRDLARVVHEIFARFFIARLVSIKSFFRNV